LGSRFSRFLAVYRGLAVGFMIYDMGDNRLLASLHLPAKIALFGIFIAKFFDHMYPYALKIYQ
jgi:hypothetical protein